MNSSEKAELLKDTIRTLYTGEGRSLSYIGRLLNINRSVVSKKVKEWNFEQNRSRRHLTPSNQKWINSHREGILSELRSGKTVKEISIDCGVGYDRMLYLIRRDDVLHKTLDDNQRKMHERVRERRKAHDAITAEPRDLDGEVWKPVLGYSKYRVSNLGRVKSCQRGYWRLMTPQPNKNTERFYVAMVDDNGKSHNLLLARVVGFSFCDGHSEQANTINHIDGDFTNNRADNLEWVTQAENNLHAYRSLGRSVVNGKRYPFKEIVFKDRYHFKTVAAFARFIGKSETQTRRYLDEPGEHEIKLVL